MSKNTKTKKKTPAKRPSKPQPNKTAPNKPAKKPAVKAAPKPAAKPATKPAVKPPVVKPSVASPMTGKAINSPRRIVQNGYSRPSPLRQDGSPKITAKVWEIADQISAANKIKADAETKRLGQTVLPSPASRQQVLAKCDELRIPYSVFQNQFYRWRKFNGLFGRVKKDGTIAKCSGGPRKYRKPLLATKTAANASETAAPTPAPIAPKPIVKPPAKPELGKALPFAVPPVKR